MPNKSKAIRGGGEGHRIVRPQSIILLLCNLLATAQLTWFYLASIPSYLRIDQYEQGLERTPFQHRVLMMYPLRWAHQSDLLQHIAAQLTTMLAWFPGGVHPEGIIEAPIDFLSIAIAGFVARRLYCAASPTQILADYVYPLTLVMVGTTYAFSAMHRLRFVYDLPSLGFFSIGLYLVYFKKSRLLFSCLFLAATLNRETTLFLLPLLISTNSPMRWGDKRDSGSYNLKKTSNERHVWVMALILLVCWIAWRSWVSRCFGANQSEAYSRFWLNIGILLWPISWSQILSAFAFSGPFIILNRRLIADPLLHRWLWIVPVWICLMLRYGIVVEARIFGELIPYVACLAALICEEKIIGQIRVHVSGFVSEKNERQSLSSTIGEW